MLALRIRSLLISNTRITKSYRDGSGWSSDCWTDGRGQLLVGRPGVFGLLSPFSLEDAF